VALEKRALQPHARCSPAAFELRARDLLEPLQQAKLARLELLL
jgi:hypothetical protein